MSVTLSNGRLVVPRATAVISLTSGGWFHTRNQPPIKFNNQKQMKRDPGKEINQFFMVFELYHCVFGFGLMVSPTSSL